jgi:hypothetical protein
VTIHFGARSSSDFLTQQCRALVHRAPGQRGAPSFESMMNALRLAAAKR